MTRHDLPDELYETLEFMGGQGTIIEICKVFWNKYKVELKESGDLFYTWQYDIRWAATELRKNKKIKSAEFSKKGVWQLVDI
ncbi:hypothetical protein [Senegalia sp. (in: firmicutes)]|uniref:hypothetical protein n=1 Tax=Senegalia sp. (in: firmicutes) TaxID=1924098 RepID=UPI003F9D2AEC